MPRKVLIIAFHFPPIQASSGVHRTLAFSRYLPEFGWQPSILTATLGAYDQIRDENLRLLPPGLRVDRAFALNTYKHLALAGRYPRLLALPDRWQSWIASGVVKGLSRIRADRPHAIMSTYPIASAHVIGLALSRLTGVPWLADFRDPMLQTDYPPDPAYRRAFGWIESRTFDRASAITVATTGTKNFYEERYGAAATRKISVIPNGYDPEAFPAERPLVPAPSSRSKPLKLLHSGLLHERDRNPDTFFGALHELRQEGLIGPDTLEVVLRASGNERDYQQRIDSLGLQTMVSLAPPLPYHDAISEMLISDGLLVFQAAGCNKQIPAKLYEYLYAGRPILGLTDPAGDTGSLLLALGIDSVAALEDRSAVKRAVQSFVDDVRAGRGHVPDEAAVAGLSRKAGTKDLAGVLDRMCRA